VLFRSIVKLIEAKTVVEVGVQLGDVAVHLCRAAKYNGGKYYGFDIWSEHGLVNQFPMMGTKETVSVRLDDQGFTNFTLTQIDTINNRKGFDDELKSLCPNGIDFAFIDADHSYMGIANDFFAVYPLMNPTGVIAFHDTARIDGCREFIHDLRTKYNDGTFDVSDYPFGNYGRHCGITIITKRSHPNTDLGIDEICGSLSEAHEIEQNEIEWFKNEIKDKPQMPRYFEGNVRTDKIGYYPSRIKFDIL
jgi:predicted O-methyltransferase YrrM